MKSILKTAALISLIALVSLAIISGCAPKPTETAAPTEPKAQAANELVVFVPCGQMGPFYDILPLFQKANPGVTVKENAENISVLARKIADGLAQPDVFMSMGDRELVLLEEKGLILPETKIGYARNSLCLMAGKENPAVKSLKEVTGPAVKTFILVDPVSSSVGYYGHQALVKLGIWEKVKGKTLTPDEPALVAASIAKGDAQAGIGYYPCVTETHTPGSQPTPKKKVQLVEVIPQDLYTPFYCTAVVVKGAKNPELGKKFIAFLQTPEAQEIFAKWNFIDPEKAPEAD
jgi:molybdate transport system substrate-binding protein